MIILHNLVIGEVRLVRVFIVVIDTVLIQVLVHSFVFACAVSMGTDWRAFRSNRFICLMNKVQSLVAIWNHPILILNFCLVLFRITVKSLIGFYERSFWIIFIVNNLVVRNIFKPEFVVSLPLDVKVAYCFVVVWGPWLNSRQRDTSTVLISRTDSYTFPSRAWWSSLVDIRFNILPGLIFSDREVFWVEARGVIFDP